jgi:hypothetical protein
MAARTPPMVNFVRFSSNKYDFGFILFLCLGLVPIDGARPGLTSQITVGRLAGTVRS